VKSRVVWTRTVWELFTELPDRDRKEIVERLHSSNSFLLRIQCERKAGGSGGTGGFKRETGSFFTASSSVPCTSGACGRRVFRERRSSDPLQRIVAALACTLFSTADGNVAYPWDLAISCPAEKTQRKYPATARPRSASAAAAGTYSQVKLLIG
jgi:hypothetical protein